MPRYVFRLEPSLHSAAEVATEEHPHVDAAIKAAADLAKELASSRSNPLERVVVMDECGTVVCDLAVSDTSLDEEEY